MRRAIGLLSIGLFCGCASSQEVRYVYQDGDFGVVGLPENTDCWPTFYRRRAEKLMEDHFPEGHKIVRAEEVIEGSRTIKRENSSTAELLPEIPKAVLSVAKLGHTESRSQADTVKVKECRIIYRRAEGPDKPEGYAEAPSLTPTYYIDPNDSERRKSADGPKPTDPGAAPEPDRPEKPGAGDRGERPDKPVPGKIGSA